MKGLDDDQAIDMLRSQIKSLGSFIARVAKLAKGELEIDDALKVLRGLSEAQQRLAAIVRTVSELDGIRAGKVDGDLKKALWEIGIELGLHDENGNPVDRSDPG